MLLALAFISCVKSASERAETRLSSTSSLEFVQCLSLVLTDQELLRLVLRETNVEELLEAAQLNLRFHNRSSATLTEAQLHVLGLGHKFIPTQYGPSARTVGVALQQFACRLYLRDFFARADHWTDAPPPPDKRLRVHNPSWHLLTDGMLLGPDGELVPYTPSPGVQEFLDDVDIQVNTARWWTKTWPLIDNVSAAQRAAVTKLRRNPQIVVCESDKNQGLMAMDAADYEALGRRCLAASATEVMAESLRCEPDAIEAMVISSVRSKLTTVLAQHSGLLQNWRRGKLDWKRRWLEKAVDRDPANDMLYWVPNV